jgi:hypothetical protein
VFHRGSGVNNQAALNARHNNGGVPSESAYQVYMRRSDGFIELYRVSAGSFILLASTTNAALIPAVGASTLLELRVRDDVKEVWIGGALILTSTNNTLTPKNSAGIGQGSAAATLTNGLHLDNFAAQDVVLTPPVTATRYRAIMMVG